MAGLFAGILLRLRPLYRIGGLPSLPAHVPYPPAKVSKPSRKFRELACLQSQTLRIAKNFVVCESKRTRDLRLLLQTTKMNEVIVLISAFRYGIVILFLFGVVPR